MHAVIDEQRAAFVLPLVAPDDPEQRCQWHLGCDVFAVGCEFGENRRHRSQIAFPDLFDQLGLAQRNGRYVPVRRRVFGQRSTRGTGDNIGDQAFARAATLSGACLRNDFADRFRPGVHARHDVAFGDAVAVAHLYFVGQFGCTCRGAGRAHVEEHADALVGQRHLLVEGLGEEADLADVAEQHRADQLVVSHHNGFVCAAARFVELDELVGVAFGTLHTHGRDIDSGHLQLGRQTRTVVSRCGIGSGQYVCEYTRLLPQWCDETVYLAAVLTAFADRVDRTFVLTTHLVVDDDSALDHQPAETSELDIGSDAGSHHDHVGRQRGVVVEADSGHPALVVAQHSGGALGRVDPDTELFDLVAQYPAAAFVQLLVHQVTGGMHHVDVDALCPQSIGRLEAEESATDHHCPHVVPGQRHLQHAVGVLDGAEPEHAAGEVPVGCAEAVHVREEGVAAGRDHQGVVVDFAAALAGDGLGEAIERDRAVTGVELDVVLAVPSHRVEHQIVVVDGTLTGQYVREHDPVVVAVRFVADHRDLESRPPTALEYLFHGSRAGHPVADHHQAFHQNSTNPKSTTISPLHPSGAAKTSSSKLSGSTSSTTRNGTFTDALAPNGNHLIGCWSRCNAT